MLRPVILTLLLFSLSFATSAQDSIVGKTCICYQIDTAGFSKIVKVGKLLNEFSPSYLDHTISLVENKDIVLLEKYYFFQKIDKQLKFDLSKKLFDLENKIMSADDSLEYERLNVLDDYLKERISLYARKLNECKENEISRKYIEKKQLILQFNQNYFNEKVSYDNSTYELAKIKYDKLITLEESLIKQVDAKMKIMVYDDSVKAPKTKNYKLFAEIIKDSKENLTEYQFQINRLKTMPEDAFHPIDHTDPAMYIVKKILVRRDTTLFQISKGVTEQVIILNNIMYIFKNDTLIKTVKNISDNGIVSAFNAYKPIAVEQVPGTFFTIQIGTFSREKLLEELKISTNVFYKLLLDGKYRYSFGVYKNMADVEKAMTMLKKIGYTHVIVIAYKDGEKITIEQAKKELSANQ